MSVTCPQGSSKGSGCLLVLDEDKRLLGTLSDGDLRRALAKTGEAALSLTVMELMNFKKPFPRTVTSDMMARAQAGGKEAGPPPHEGCLSCVFWSRLLVVSLL